MSGSACSGRGLGQLEVAGTCLTDRSPRWRNSTISALNSGVNERRGRGFFLPMLSMVGHRFRGEPLMMDVVKAGQAQGGDSGVFAFARIFTCLVWMLRCC